MSTHKLISILNLDKYATIIISGIMIKFIPAYFKDIGLLPRCEVTKSRNKSGAYSSTSYNIDIKFVLQTVVTD